MLKKIIATTLVATALMFSGCGDDTEGLDQLAAQNAIDTGSPALAIDILLDGQTLSSALDTLSDEDKILLGSAYMTEAGFSMTDIVLLVMTDDTNATSAFDSFKTQVLTNSDANSLTNVENAILCYEQSSLTAAPSKADALPVISDEDLKLALALLVKAVLLYTGDASDADIASFINDAFALLINMNGLEDLEAEIYKVKVDIASQAGTDIGLTYVDGTDYSSISVEAADVATYR